MLGTNYVLILIIVHKLEYVYFYTLTTLCNNLLRSQLGLVLFCLK